MLKSIRLRNLRSFANDDDAPYIDLKPLTVLIGKNSSGKSTFLRSLPLLRQSVEANTTGPILWYSSYVDFGAFSEAKKIDSKTNVIYFDFKFRLSLKKNQNYRHQLRYYSRFRFRVINTESISTTIKVGVTEIDNKTILKELYLKLYENNYKFIFNDKNKCEFFINDVLSPISEDLSYLTLNQFLPVIFIGVQRNEYRHINEEGFNEYFYSILYTDLKKYFGNTKASTVKEGIARIGVNKREDIKEILTKIFKNNKTFIKNVSKNEISICDLVYNYSLSANIINVLNTLNLEMEETFRNIKYIAPLRSTAERYYRHQDLQIKEIDHTGSNMAMLLKSFSKKENIDFTEWTYKNFGFNVRVEEKGLHYAIKIQTENDSKEYNINDMGFGFSQILPIVTSIWIETSKYTSKNRARLRGSEDNIIFAIEQPELHLHPEYQSRLAKMFVSVINVAKDNDVSLKIIFETHSQTMVDTFGDCIEEGDLKADNVNIVLFDKELDGSTTAIRFSHFNNEGFLEEWPIGFFSGRT